MRRLSSDLQNNLNIKKMIAMGLSLMTLSICILGTLGIFGQFTVRKSVQQMLASDILVLDHVNQTSGL